MKSKSDKTIKRLLRQRAEMMITKSKLKLTSKNSEVDQIKMIHELEVHRIELELQNEELLFAKEQAEHAEEKYTELYDFAPSGYVSLSKNGIITQLNLSASRMLGKDRLYLTNIPFVSFLSDETRLGFVHFLQHIFDTREKETCEVVIMRPNLPLIYVLLEGILHYDEEQCQVTMIDITARKLIEKAIHDREMAEESDRLKTAFLHNMSHEIRSPMNAIMGFSELLPQFYNNKSKIEHFSKIIYQRSSDLLNIINDILDIAKIESGQLSVTIEKIDINIMFDELREFFTEQQERLCKQNIDFSIESLNDPALQNIMSDKVKLKQILINLISNAFKFTEKGSITVGCNWDMNQNIMFYVADTGIGIPAERQSLVFQRFKQYNQSLANNVGGTGLGLSIVKGLVDLLGGDVQLISDSGSGSTFSFTLPNAFVQTKSLSVFLVGK